MKEIKRISINSCARVLAMVMAIIGFLAGIYATFFSMGACQAPDHSCRCLIQFCPLYSDMKGWAIIVFPVIYAIIGFVFGLIGAYIYNLVAGWVGGIKIELED